jgi:hypothetical protein
MNRVNNTRRGVACNARIFTAIIAVAITFTFNACGSDDSGGGNTVACKTTKTNGEFYCYENPKDMVVEAYGSVEGYNESVCEGKKLEKERLSYEFLNSCPGGYTYKCENTAKTKTLYLYAERYKGVSCDEIVEL